VCLPHPNTVAMTHSVTWVLVAVTWAVVSPADGCNKALCASDVSKCLLQEVCQCEANRAGCPCCQECAFCLGNLWESCCECVGLCDERPFSAPRPAQRSSMHNLMSPVPSLFRALMAISDNDSPMGWSILTLPVEEERKQNHAETDHLLLGPHTGRHTWCRGERLAAPTDWQAVRHRLMDRHSLKKMDWHGGAVALRPSASGRTKPTNEKEKVHRCCDKPR
ncbi:hypothetical protein JD844_001002, partial [Phrynosoma platyrhinos]